VSAVPINAVPTNTVPINAVPINAVIPISVNTEADASAARTSPTTLSARAEAAGFAVLAASAWPESAADVTAPLLAGFVFSSFSPVAAEVAGRCLERRTAPRSAAAVTTGVIVASRLGDVAGARHVARAVDADARIGPLLFFQCVPNAVAGYVAARWRLTGPVACLGGERAALDTAGLLLEDGDADQVLLICVDQALTADEHDRAGAVLLGTGTPTYGRGRA
jgi:3-oxoacyl-(acyl-carrier-protein) synthase